MALHSKDGHTEKGVSLARGPALVVGAVLLSFGLLAFLTEGTAPTDGFPDGTITESERFLGFAVNDWTAFFTAAAGGLLLFGAAQHVLAKTMSLLVGLALGACSLIALYDGEDVLGLAAANGPVKLAWGIAAAVLLLNALLPRKRGKQPADGRGIDASRTAAVPSRHAAGPRGAGPRDTDPRDEGRSASEPRTAEQRTTEHSTTGLHPGDTIAPRPGGTADGERVGRDTSAGDESPRR